MDNVQNYVSYVNILSSQTFKYYVNTIFTPQNSIARFVILTVDHIQTLSSRKK
jgi:hypothetical protein